MTTMVSTSQLVDALMQLAANGDHGTRSSRAQVARLAAERLFSLSLRIPDASTPTDDSTFDSTPVSRPVPSSPPSDAGPQRAPDASRAATSAQPRPCPVQSTHDVLF